MPFTYCGPTRIVFGDRVLEESGKHIPFAERLLIVTGKSSAASHGHLDRLLAALGGKRAVVFSGVSGSGKSSLAFDTLYAEGQRRYVESLSSYARQFLGQMEKPLYDTIRGLSPTISVDQKSSSHNPCCCQCCWGK